MPAIATNTLVEEAKCYSCTGEVSFAQSLELALLRRQLLSLNVSADVTMQGLVEYAKCYACYGLSTFDLLKIALLDQISQL